MSDLKKYFNRQTQLWGEKTQESLSQKNVLIIGSGGLGSAFGYALGSSGIGAISVVDFDRIALENIHRQILFSLEDIGEFKVDIFKKRLESRFDGVEISTYKTKADEFFDTFLQNKNLQICKFDLILDATDNLQTRAQIDKFAKKLQIPWIFTSVDSWQTQICFIDKSDFRFFPSSSQKPAGITPPIVMLAGSFAANLALRYLANLQIQKDMLYYLDLFSGEFSLKKINL